MVQGLDLAYMYRIGENTIGLYPRCREDEDAR
jgi:hypothetical protein